MPAQRASILARASFGIAAVIVVAVIAAAAYEIEANRQHIGLIAIERTLQSKNVDNMPFDPGREALVIDPAIGIDLLFRYQVPAVYERAPEGTFTALTIASPQDCQALSRDVAAMTLSDLGLTFCIAETVVPPPANILDVGTADPFTELDGRPFFPAGPAITFVRNGRRQGTFTAGWVEVLPYIPHLAATCNPTCGITFVPDRIALDALSGPSDSRTADPLAAILGLTPRSAAELTTLGWAKSDPEPAE